MDRHEWLYNYSAQTKLHCAYRHPDLTEIDLQSEYLETAVSEVRPLTCHRKYWR